MSLAVFAVLFIAYVAFKVLGDTMQYRSTAQTPWATPLIWPQGVWYAGLVIFALLATATRRAPAPVVDRAHRPLNHDFHPKSAKEELKEELDDLAVRQAGEGAKP